MNKSFLKRVMLATIFVCLTQFGFAQKEFKLSDNPYLKVSGTSTLHDWDMPSLTATGSMTATEMDGKLTEITSLHIVMPAESIKSGKKGMDKKAYEAMKTKSHKNVIFDLKSASKSGDTWTLIGTFNIAGTKKQVAIKAKESKKGDLYGLNGDYSFKLSEYNITPPTAMMGTIKTGDEVKISFDVKFK